MSHPPRKFWVATSAVFIALVLAVTATGQPVAKAGPNDPTILFGVHPGSRGAQTPQQVLMDLEQQAGRSLNGVRVFELWDSAFPDSYHTWLKNTGHTMYLSVKSKRENGSIVLWRDIVNAQPGSTLYNQIVGWATDIKNYGDHVYFTFNHEPEAGASDAMGTPAEFISAWRKVVDIFRQQNVTNASYTFINTDYAWRVTDGRRAALWYPGDAWVDAVGTDDYNWYDCRPGIETPWRTLEWIAEPFRVWGQSHPSVELMLTEWASHEDSSSATRKANWITEARNLFKQPGWEQFTTLLYFDKSLKPTCDFWLDSSSNSMNAWLAMANDPFYSRTDAPDSSPPTVPGQPGGASTAPGSIDLTWAASDDDLASTLTYRVFRDGGATAVGTFTSSSTSTVSFRDTGLSPGETYSYRVSASDGPNTSALSQVSADITVISAPTSLFADGFAAGFANWTSVNGLTSDATRGAPAAPSARAAVNGARASASKALGTTTPVICMSERVNLTSIGGNSVSLLRLRTTNDSGIARVFISSSRQINLRSDVTGAQFQTGSTLPLGSWRQIELCGDIAGGGRLSVYLDGVLIGGPWTQSLGTAPFGRVMVGDSDVKTVTVNYDDIVVDTAAG